MTDWLHSLGSNLFALPTLLCLMLTSLALGGVLVFRRSTQRGSLGIQSVLIALVVGLDLIGLISIASGLMGLLTPITAKAFLLTGAFVGVAFMATTIRHLIYNNFDYSRICSLCVFMGYGVLTLGPALCYPSGWDELTYHVELPLRWSIDSFPLVYKDNPYSGFPCLPEMVYWCGVLAGGITTPRLIAWSSSIIVFAALQRLLCHSMGDKAGTIIAVAFASAPITLTVSSEAYVEQFHRHESRRRDARPPA